MPPPTGQRRHSVGWAWVAGTTTFLIVATALFFGVGWSTQWEAETNVIVEPSADLDANIQSEGEFLLGYGTPVPTLAALAADPAIKEKAANSVGLDANEIDTTTIITSERADSTVVRLRAFSSDEDQANKMAGAVSEQAIAKFNELGTFFTADEFGSVSVRNARTLQPTGLALSAAGGMAAGLIAGALTFLMIRRRH